jgi:AcrR family transcriptional regulator
MAVSSLSASRPSTPVQPEPDLVRRRGRPASNAAHAVPEQRVLDAAFSAFAALGYEGTAVRELAKQLGVSHNLLNVRFGSKADLWRRAVDARVARFGSPVFAAFDEQTLDDEARLRLVVERFCGWTSENPDFVGIAYAEGRRATWRLDYLVDAYIRPFKQQLDALFESVAASHPMRRISSTAFMVMLVQGAGFYFAARPMLEKIGEEWERDPGQTQRQVRELTDFLLAGLLGGSR